MSSRANDGQWWGIALLDRVVMLTGLFLVMGSAGCSMTVALDGPKNQAVDSERTAAAHPESAVGVLRRMLEHEDPDVRLAAVRELRDMGPAAGEAVPDLREITEERDRVMRYEAARALVAIAPQDPVAAPTLVMIAKDPRSSEEQRRESIAMLQRMGRGADLVEPAANGGTIKATTRPAGAASGSNAGSGPLKVSDVEADDRRSVNIGSIGPATRPAEDVEMRTREAERTVAPSTKPAAPQPPDDPVFRIPGLWRSTDSPGQRPPSPDIDEHGIESYTATKALLVKDWIDRQPGTAAERKERWEQFVRWRSEQDRQIYAKVVNK